MKTKTYVITLSTHFPKGHPREGEETEFEGKVIAARQIEMRPVFRPAKIHTIRADYEKWKKRIDEVNAGRAVLSVRQWLGAPRRSKQREILRLDKDSGIGVERLEWRYDGMTTCTIYGNEGTRAFVNDEAVAGNDGLTFEDWAHWFADPRYDLSQPMAIIHFTNFRYCK